ncbi:MAG: penicillin-binding protein 2 [Patescibacteria group bacterium]|nr:penicillin-binding protein 2 [bacterium]MDZ4240659.1 penicillin-binding protein 2 [Patescibacteria group bacterium]
MKAFPGRLRFLSVIFLLFSLLLLSRLYFVQVVSGEEYRLKADKQYVRQDVNLFNRGTIYFETKDGGPEPMAFVRSGFTVAINPSILADAQSAYVQISSAIALDRDAFLAKAAKKEDPYEEIAKRVDETTAKKIEALKISGVNIYTEKWRFYPAESLASHLIGFLGYKDDTLAGRYGLERYYEDTLARESGGLYINFFAEIFSNLKENIAGEAKHEGNIVATIEPTVQSFLERELKKIDETWNSDEVGGIIINPKTGEIYAMGAYPTFNLNTFQNEEDPHVFSNPLVENVYEMGSIIKPLTVAAALDTGAITASTTYDDKGYLILNNARISNFDGKGRGIVDMQEVLNQSLNTGAAFAMFKMGKEAFVNYMKAYKVGDETGIDLPNETYGLIDNLDSGRDIELATAAYGQGIAFTPIATVRALSALGNGGLLINPHLVKKINYKNGLSKTIAIDRGERVLKQETSEEITRMLVRVVDEALLGGTVKLPHYSVAAKTGTAQVVGTGGGGYQEGKYLHSFFGYFPAYDPEFLVFLFTMDPKGVRYASETLTHPFIDITKFLINYYEVPFDR